MVKPLKSEMVAVPVRATAEDVGTLAAEPGGVRAALYQTIASTLQREIAEGILPVASMLPTETELCYRFGASRSTIREALKQLADFGLVQSKAGAGTVVVADTPPATFVHRLGSMRELLAYPDTTYRELISTENVVADERISELIDCPLGSEWFLMRCIRKHHDSSAPISVGEFFILPEIGAAIDWPETDSLTIGQRIEMNTDHRVHTTTVRIFASAIRGELTGILKVGEGTPGMSMVRSYIDAEGQSFASSVTVHPEHRFVYSVDLTRDE